MHASKPYAPYRRTGWLLVIAFATALVVVTVRHANRLAFVHLQQAEQQRDELQIEWGRLTLEKSTWGSEHSIAEQAQAKFAMRVPAPEKIITVTTSRPAGLAKQ